MFKERYSLKKSIFLFLKYRNGEWVSGLEIEKLALSGYFFGKDGMKKVFKGATADRRCRDLEEEGLVERDDTGGFVRYRYLPPKPKTEEEEEAERQRLLIEALK